MGGTNSRGGGAFVNMHEDQPLTPPTPRRDVVQPWSFSEDDNKQELQSDAKPTAQHEGDREGMTDGHQARSDIENVPTGDGSNVSEESTNTANDKTPTDDNDRYLVEITPVYSKLKLEGRTPSGSEGQMKKKKLTSILRTLSASAASSSARMSTKSTTDRSRMVEQGVVHSESVEEESTPTAPGDAINSSRSSSVLRMFRHSPYAAVTAANASSKYSPMHDE